ncbi:aspartate--tRNA ligase [Candidatus Aerophobetes bacterium]|uniref:Aspartate--tRNA(Asp/Asn) ligase n=1 Tax=Aerophobetes bacterium TaxID=2030807 RepID=A0A2A4X247_UNCAE|nr:MAG: aspartate--tRNA ligase [Candidatus Aerophobetes bacterium]
MQLTLDYKRTCNCGALRKEDVGKSVALSGWVHKRRDLGGLIFIDLRDRWGLTQIIFHPETAESSYALAKTLRHEWVIHIKGEVRAREAGMENKDHATGSIEVSALHLHVLSESKTPPFSLFEDLSQISEDLRLEYRYLDIRAGRVASLLEIRHRAMMIVRSFLDQREFIEVNTPILGKSTPEGARDYLVPSRIFPSSFYALPQSPQIFKQLLMLAGMDRYFQIAPCFRDEDLRSDRQPEFMQIDIEMSFLTFDDLKEMIETMLNKVFKETVDVKLPPFQVIDYSTCIENYGTDRPDLRFAMNLVRVDDLAKRCKFSVFSKIVAEGGIVKGICVKNGASFSRKTVDQYTEFVSHFGLKGLAFAKVENGTTLASGVSKFFTAQEHLELIKSFNAAEGDLLLFAASREKIVNQSLDHLRRKIAADTHLLNTPAYAPLWVVDFPLFEEDETTGRLKSVHHPFTSPCPEDLDKLETSPLEVKSIGYDVVINGYELGGGSQRIHDPKLQKTIFEKLNLSPESIEEKFGFFVRAMQYGAPPHLGIALGVERLVMLLGKTTNIKDVVAFPKNLKASDLMMKTPSTVDDEQLKELGLDFRVKK